jgi:hypothetical protein
MVELTEERQETLHRLRAWFRDEIERRGLDPEEHELLVNGIPLSVVLDAAAN